MTISDAKSTRRGALFAILAVAASWAAEATCQWLHYGPEVTLNVWGVLPILAQTFLHCAALVIGLLCVGRLDLLSRAITANFALLCLISPAIWWRASTAAEPEPLSAPMTATLLALPVMLVLMALTKERGRRMILLALPPAALLFAAEFATVQWLPWEPMLTAVSDPETAYVPLDIETIYLSQDALLRDQIAALAPQRAGQVDVFALTLGGTSYQSVFARQVDAVADLLHANYGAGPRTLRLLNSEDTPLRYPVANTANLRAALAAIGARMGPEDMAFLYLASHGARDLFALSFPELGLHDLTAPDLADMLQDARIPASVIVLSACYSGSFADDLAAPNRLLIMAAAANRTSFGCADGVNWTEFDAAFFDRALRQQPDPRKAFDLARTDVWWTELKTLRRHSNPQIILGDRMATVLQSVLDRKP